MSESVGDRILRICRSLSCPFCDAWAGKPCLSKNGKPMPWTRPHQARWRRAQMQFCEAERRHKTDLEVARMFAVAMGARAGGAS